MRKTRARAIHNSFSILEPHLNGGHCSRISHGDGASLVPEIREQVVVFQQMVVLRNTLGSVLRVGLIFVVAVLDSPLGVLVTAGNVVLGERIGNDIGPLASLRSAQSFPACPTTATPMLLHAQALDRSTLRPSVS